VQFVSRHVGVVGVQVDVLSEVCLDAGNTHLQQRLQQTLVPSCGFRAGKVDGACVIVGAEIGPTLQALTVGRDVVVFQGLLELPGPFGNVGQLPETDPETLILKPFQKSRWVGKTLGVEGPFTQPVGGKPTRIQVHHVAGITFLPQPGADSFHLFGREIGHPAHPDAIAPQR